MNLKTVSFLFVMCVLISACSSPQGMFPYEITVSNQDDILNSAVLTFPVTVQILDQMISGNAPAGSFIMEMADSYLFGFPWRDNFAIINLSQNGWEARHLGDLVRMNTSSPLSLTKTLTQLESQGGHYISSQQLPLTLVTEIQGLITWALRVGASLFELPIFVFPFGTFEMDMNCIGGCING